MAREEIKEAGEALKRGETLLYLSDTIWGIGCDPKNEEAVQKIIEIKERPIDKSFIVLISEIGQLYNYVNDIPEVAWDIIEFAEDPLTIIFSGAKNLPKKVIASDGSIAIRLVKDPDCKRLVQLSRNGLLSTSANISGQPSPKAYSEISSAILNGVDYIVNSSKESKNKSSKIIKLGTDGEFELIRN